MENKEMTAEQLHQWYAVNTAVLQEMKAALLVMADNCDTMIQRYQAEKLRLKLEINTKTR